jgi:DNA-binding XRE family transcriptional regulator
VPETTLTADPARLAIPQRLAQLRKDHGLPQRKIADALGISDRPVTRWENGIHSPSVEHTISYAHLVGCRLVARRGDQVIDVAAVLQDLRGFRRRHGLTQTAFDRRARGTTRAALLEMRGRRGTPIRLVTLEAYFAALGWELGLASAERTSR